MFSIVGNLQHRIINAIQDHVKRWLRPTITSPMHGAAGELFSVNPGAAEVIRGVFDDFDAGATLRSIAARLNVEGIPTRRGGRWHAATVRYMLDNGFYAGLAQWHGEETAIITKEQYRSIHARLLSLRRGNPTFGQAS